MISANCEEDTVCKEPKDLRLRINIRDHRDLDGGCPNTTFEYSEYGNPPTCCCSIECCLDHCTLEEPPEDCIKGIPNTKWIYSEKLGWYYAVRLIIPDPEGKSNHNFSG